MRVVRAQAPRWDGDHRSQMPRRSSGAGRPPVLQVSGPAGATRAPELVARNGRPSLHQGFVHVFLSRSRGTGFSAASELRLRRAAPLDPVRRSHPAKRRICGLHHGERRAVVLYRSSLRTDSCLEERRQPGRTAWTIRVHGNTDIWIDLSRAPDHGNHLRGGARNDQRLCLPRIGRS